MTSPSHLDHRLCQTMGMGQDFFVRKVRHGTDQQVGDTKPLSSNRSQTMPSQEITPEGIDAVASALGMERVEQEPVRMSGLPPAEQLALGLQRLANGE